MRDESTDPSAVRPSLLVTSQGCFADVTRRAKRPPRLHKTCGSGHDDRPLVATPFCRAAAPASVLVAALRLAARTATPVTTLRIVLSWNQHGAHRRHLRAGRVDAALVTEEVRRHVPPLTEPAKPVTGARHVRSARPKEEA
eukprot:CAMPEP_0171085146 /NCGR_PEP_ID=MMETSP0766_2-20121228/18762_1 /TAXON_ID=439317 /ORGANISM="Gambierdiscus australes, Strain CAWD 149" /LENGTH=140 /DNA_ID=CAMNT_0011542697 /DNA_START=19 /DNA_END=442 /DNA_ORIENTATION=-